MRYVLILVLVEMVSDPTTIDFLRTLKVVLILVLVDDGLCQLQLSLKKESRQSLNPCFSGWWSLSEKTNR